MNMSYGMAVMALRGDVGAADYALDRIADPQVLAFLPRIFVYEDAGLEARGPAFRHAARVTVRTNDGKTLLREVYDRRGSPENDVSHKEVAAKFRPNARAVLPSSAVQRLETLVASLEKPAALAEVIAILSAAAAA